MLQETPLKEKKYALSGIKLWTRKRLENDFIQNAILSKLL
jgi:hypothetical protein